MNNTPTKKQQTHQRMLTAASQAFRSNGYAGIGVDGIAKAAGVTSGAFYAHFGSKDKAFTAALMVGLDEVIETLPKIKEQAGSQWVQVFVDYYISDEHRNDLTCGCAMATLSPEVVRREPQVHNLYEEKMTQIVTFIADNIEGHSSQDRTAKAWSLLGILIGGLTMMRAVNGTNCTTQIAAAIRDCALNVINLS